MNILQSITHPSLASPKKIFERQAVRGIILKNDEILMIYTSRYDDYTLPGGGIEDQEDHLTALKREMREEAGAIITQTQPVGIYEELRPTYYEGYDAMHMLSYIYLCEASDFIEPEPEEYEIQNGSVPKWIKIKDAIRHNEKTMADQGFKGYSIQRETFLLNYILEHIKKH